MLNLTLREVASAYRRDELSPTAYLEELLLRIADKEPQLHTFRHLMIAEAREQASAAERELREGIDRGALHGIPVTLKDNIAVAGIPLTNGSYIQPPCQPTAHALVTQRLLDAGAVIVGKAHLHEFAYGPHHPAFPLTRNPWDNDRIPGGSSSGSAAGIAAGFATLSIGTDSAGSVRVPASFCGITGFKPTYGRIPMDGITPLAASLDHVGLLARSCEEAEIAFRVLDGAVLDGAVLDGAVLDGAALDGAVLDGAVLDGAALDGAAPSLSLEADPPSLRGIRLGVPQAYLTAPTEPEVVAVIRAALAALSNAGADIIPLELGIPIASIKEMTWTLLHAEAYRLHQESLTAWQDGYGAGLKANLARGRQISASVYAQAIRWRDQLRGKVLGVYEGVDAIITPTCPCAARPYHAVLRPEQAVNGEYTPYANLWGLPAVSVTAGFSVEGLPIGMQITGQPYRDYQVLSIGSRMERLMAMGQL